MGVAQRLMAHAISPYHTANNGVSRDFIQSTLRTGTLYRCRNNKCNKVLDPLSLLLVRCPSATRVRGMSSFATTTTITTTSSNNKNKKEEPTKFSTIKIYNALDQGCMDYSKSWAWQYLLLNRRLAYRRRRKTDSSSSTAITAKGEEDDDDDDDCILLLEHAPVYTLGRGSDESHLTFLNSNSSTTTSEKERIAMQQQLLSRKARGPGTARLAVDRRQQLTLLDTTINNDDDVALYHAIETLSNLATPVVSPNGVPIYRVERGGEVTFHGPSQLVVYPLFDLKRRPYKQDLHWYLRMIEEVVIQTLEHYGIEGQRDEENTGMSLFKLRVNSRSVLSWHRMVSFLGFYMHVFADVRLRQKCIGVWVNDEKVAAVGISSSRWITTHGFALNVNPNLEYFDTSVILPCGIEGKGVTSISELFRQRRCDEPVPTLSQVSEVVLQSIQTVFGVSNFQIATSPDLQSKTSL